MGRLYHGDVLRRAAVRPSIVKVSCMYEHADPAGERHQLIFPHGQHQYADPIIDFPGEFSFKKRVVLVEGESLGEIGRRETLLFQQSRRKDEPFVRIFQLADVHSNSSSSSDQVGDF